MTPDDAPVGDVEFAELMSALGLNPESGPVAVAVSGGADSMALALLAARWGRVHALTVDHGLSEESADEAAQVADWLEARGIAHSILVWRGDKPRHGIQAAARQARYRLLDDWCGAQGIHTLLLAHHRDDQAETFLLRLARGSGLSGLAAMQPVSRAPDGGPARYRPLLEVPKSRLVATCRAAEQDWIEQPANSDPRFQRSHARALLAAPPLEGLTAPRLAATARRLGRARAALEHYLEQHYARAVTEYPAGYASFAPAVLQDAPEEIALRCLSRCLCRVGGRAYPLRLKRLERLYGVLRHDGAAATATLAGCRVMPGGEGEIIVCRELAGVAGSVIVEPGATRRWDGRFLIGNDSVTTIEVSALGRADRQALRRDAQGARTPDTVPAIPAVIAETLPAIRIAGRLRAVPHLGLTDHALPVRIDFAPVGQAA